MSSPISPTPDLSATAALVVAGYTGSDPAAVQHHIDELAAIGVPAPTSVPAYYPLARDLVTSDLAIAVESGYTSGEVEPVLIRVDGNYWLTVGSDHTDRDLERTDIARSKAACPKPIGSMAIALGDAPEVTGWNRVRIRSWVDGDLYQDGTLAALRPLADTLSRRPAGTEGDLVLFGGTVPLIDGTFRAGADWRLTLEAPGCAPLELCYSVKVRNP